MNDAVYDNSQISGWHSGYADSKASIDINTFCRFIPWDDGMPFFVADFSESEELAAACPRTLLKRVRKQAIDMGYTTNFAKEFEWFNFKETPGH